MKKGMNLDEQLIRMKSLMSEERLHGNLVDVDDTMILKEAGGGGVKFAKYVEDMFKAAEKTGAFNHLASGAGFNTLVDYFNAFKTAPMNTVDDFIKSGYKYKELWEELARLSSGGGKFDLQLCMDTLLVASTKGKNLFKAMSNGNPVYSIFPKGPFRDRALAAYKESLDNLDKDLFTNFMKTEIKLQKPILSNIITLQTVKAGKHEGAYIVNTVEDVQTFLKTIGIEDAGNKIFITNPALIDDVLAEGAEQLMKENKLIYLLNPKTGILEAILPPGAVQQMLKRDLSAITSKIPWFKGFLQLLYSNVLKSHYSPFSNWRRSKTLERVHNIRKTRNVANSSVQYRELSTKTAAINWGTKALVGSGTIWAGCIALGFLIRDTQGNLPSWCNPINHGGLLVSGFQSVAKRIGGVILNMLCEKINDEKEDDEACEKFRLAVEEGLEELSSENICERVPWDKIDGVTYTAEDWLAEEQVRIINGVARKHDVKGMDGWADFIVKINSDFGVGSTTMRNNSKNLENKCMNKGVSEAEGDGIKIADGSEIIVATAQEGDKEVKE